MNVTELARRLQVPTKELLERMPKLGFSVGRRAIKIDDRLVERITEAFTKDKQKRVEAEREAGVREVSLDAQGQRSAGEGRRSQPLPIGDVIIVRDLAQAMGLPVARLIGELMRNGVMATINERIDYETAAIIAEDLGYKPQRVSGGAEDQFAATLGKVHEAEADVRPPIVVVMGHVDHGKTSLLDAIRSANVAAGESGHITQRIGAYQAVARGRAITFLDTPGHEAFATMRSRGGRVADVAIIVVAADDGVQPQTIEALQIVQRESLPFVVAINKVDKAEANLDRIKQQLAELNVATEDYGGKAVAVPVSAKTKQGLDELLETVLLVSDLNPPRASAEGLAVGAIIEAHVDQGEGPVATVLVQRGTLRANDWLLIGDVVGRVRLLKDEHGLVVSEAGPSKPVKVLGLRALPSAGDRLDVTEDEGLVRERLKAMRRRAGRGLASVAVTAQAAEAAAEGEASTVKPELRLVLKADTLGSLEALDEVIGRFHSSLVAAKVVKRGLGTVNDADVIDAHSAGATVVAFHVSASPSAEELSTVRQVPLLQDNIIYHLLEVLEERLGTLVPPEVLRRQLGTIQVLALFRAKGAEQVVGGRVVAGVVKPQTRVKVVRGGATLGYGDLLSLQSAKEEVAEVAEGTEAGMKLRCNEAVRVGDALEVFQEEVNRRKLDAKLR